MTELDQKITHLQELQVKHRRNIRRLEEQLASYGMKRPLDLINELDFEQEQLRRVEERLKELVGPSAGPPSPAGIAPMPSDEVLTSPPMRESPPGELWTALTSGQQRRGCYAEYGRILKIAILLLALLVIGGIILSDGVPLMHPTPTAVAIVPTVTPTCTLTPRSIDTSTPAPTDTPFPNTPTPTYTLMPYRPTTTPASIPIVKSTPVYCAIVKAEVLNVRSGPSTRYDTVGVLKQGDLLQVTGRDLEGNWLKVIGPDGKESWVARSYVEAICPIGVAVAMIPPTPTPLPAPILLRPENTGRFSEHYILLTWGWIRPLGKNEYFSVRIRPEGDPEACWHPHTTATQYIGDPVGCESGKHYWSVVVARRAPDSPTSWWEISRVSEERWFDFFRPDEDDCCDGPAHH